MQLPEMILVQSSNVASVGYDVSTQTLFVEFLNGNIYIYIRNSVTDASM